MKKGQDTRGYERYRALDIHREYILVGSWNAEKDWVLPPRRVSIEKFAEWAKKNIRSGDIVVLETTTNVPTVAPTAELGKTRDKPLPRSSTVDIGGNMQVTITNVQRPANDIVAQGNMFNATPIPNVQEYMIVKLHVKCKKPVNEKCNFSRFEFKTVGRDGQVHDQAILAGVPLEIEPYTEFFGGASIDGNTTFLVTLGDTSVVLFHDPLIFGDPVYISLQP